jgi:hypothetical protein
VPSNTGSITNSASLLKIANNAAPIEITANTNSGRANQLVLTAAGAVGMGLNNPASNLQVTDGSNHSLMFFCGTTNKIQSMTDAGGAWVPFEIYAAGGFSLNPTGGLIGIGMAAGSSSYPLDISGSAGTGGAAGVMRLFASAQDVGLHILNTGAGGREYTLFSSGTGSGIGAGNFTIYDNGAGAARFQIGPAGQIALYALPAANPGAGTKQLWYDPADGNRVKFAP